MCRADVHRRSGTFPKPFGSFKWATEEGMCVGVAKRLHSAATQLFVYGGSGLGGTRASV